ncbi:hypothetical protein GCWU000324_00324 [Kingella oralis ATCC 51147]|uniref:Uncharacterized protein n=1 Tax=Kingella oralis ATCC 51147 TaxID=629741 RepID=C4GHJ0_9NEIS|nr:hypothetical protein GCWU000324_00324 [Kingella oralis ATCC 51147]
MSFLLLAARDGFSGCLWVETELFCKQGLLYGFQAALGLSRGR